jgi:hypothetical protein
MDAETSSDDAEFFSDILCAGRSGAGGRGAGGRGARGSGGIFSDFLNLSLPSADELTQLKVQNANKEAQKKLLAAQS